MSKNYLKTIFTYDTYEYWFLMYLIYNHYNTLLLEIVILKYVNIYTSITLRKLAMFVNDSDRKLNVPDFLSK